MGEQANVKGTSRGPLPLPGFPFWVHLKYFVQDEAGDLWVNRSASTTTVPPVLARMSRMVCGYVKDDRFRTGCRVTDWSKTKGVKGAVDETSWMKVMWF